MKTLIVVAMSIFLTGHEAYAFQKNVKIESQENFSANGEEGFFGRGVMANLRVTYSKTSFAKIEATIVCENRTEGGSPNVSFMIEDEAGDLRGSDVDIDPRGGPASNSEAFHYEVWHHFCRK